MKPRHSIRVLQTMSVACSTVKLPGVRQMSLLSHSFINSYSNCAMRQTAASSLCLQCVMASSNSSDSSLCGRIINVEVHSENGNTVTEMTRADIIIY